MSHPGISSSGHILVSNGVTHQYTVLSGDIAGIAHDTKLRRLMGANVVDATPQDGLFLGYDGANFTLLPASGAAPAATVAASSIFPTGLLIGEFNQSGILLTSNINGQLAIRNSESGVGGVIIDTRYNPKIGWAWDTAGPMYLTRLGNNELAITAGNDPNGANKSSSAIFYATNVRALDVRPDATNPSYVIDGSNVLFRFNNEPRAGLTWSLTTSSTGPNAATIQSSGYGILAFTRETNNGVGATGLFGVLNTFSLGASGSRIAPDTYGNTIIQDGEGTTASGIMRGLTLENPTGRPYFDSTGSTTRLFGGTNGWYGALHLSSTSYRDTSANVVMLLSALTAKTVYVASDTIFGFSNSTTNVLTIDSAIVRSGVQTFALTNPSTYGPADLLVGDLTVLGNHNITASNIYPTGLIVGAFNASGIKLVSDANGTLLLQNGIDQLLGDMTLRHLDVNGILTVKDTAHFDDAGFKVTIAPTNPSINLTSDGRFVWANSTTTSDITISTDSDMALARSGLGILGFSNPITQGAASGLFGATIYNTVSTNGALIKNDVAATLRIRNGNDTADGHLIVNDITILGTQTGGGGGGPHNLLSTTHSDTETNTVVRGDIIYGSGATPVWTKMPLGAAGRVLYSNGTDVAYTQLGSVTPHSVGSLASPSITFLGDTNTGWSAQNADVMIATAGGSGLIEVNGVINTVKTYAGQILQTRIVSSSTNLTEADYIIICSGTNIGIGLIQNPQVGRTFVVKDGFGSTSSPNPITVSGITRNIDGNATSIIRTSYASFTYVYNGVQWNVI